MNDTEFVDLVARMRRAQIRHFEDRGPVNLSNAKNLERQVDHAIEMAKDKRTLLGFMSDQARAER